MTLRYIVGRTVDGWAVLDRQNNRQPVAYCQSRSQTRKLAGEMNLFDREQRAQAAA